MSTLPPDPRPIETRYAGCHFRSRLEARWAVFFDQFKVPWEYEPQGYELSFRRYLPDFLLTDCSTFVEVRGSNERVDLDELALIATELPDMPLGVNEWTDRDDIVHSWSAERGPKLMLLGPLPSLTDDGDPGWLGHTGFDPVDDEPSSWMRWGFGNYHKNRRPWWLSGAIDDYAHPLQARFDDLSGVWDVRSAYIGAKSARFEHGQSGAT